MLFPYNSQKVFPTVSRFHAVTRLGRELYVLLDGILRVHYDSKHTACFAMERLANVMQVQAIGH